MNASDFSTIARDYGAYLIEDAGRLSTAEMLDKPHLVQTIVDNLSVSLDAIEKGLAKYEAERIDAVAKAADPDDHKQEIAAGAISFQAFRDARGGA